MDLSDLANLGATPSALDAVDVDKSTAAKAGPAKILVVSSGPVDTVESLVHRLRLRRFTVRVCEIDAASVHLQYEAWDVVLLDANGCIDNAHALTVAIRAAHSASEVPILVLGTEDQ